METVVFSTHERVKHILFAHHVNGQVTLCVGRVYTVHSFFFWYSGTIGVNIRQYDSHAARSIGQASTFND